MTVVLVTGASGFLGQYVVAELLRQGYQVRATIRPTTQEKNLAWANHPNLAIVRLDLREKQGINEALQGIDSVIHLAAAKTGDYNTRWAGTVKTTENLLNAMIETKVLRLIAISTFSVYDWINIPAEQIIDENSPIDTNPIYRDEYAQTKLIQEKIIREFEQTQQAQVTIIRPGMIYGRDNLWNAYLGAQLKNNLWLIIKGEAVIPLTYVENCAQAIVCALNQQAIGETINIVDDDLPKQNVYLRQILSKTSQPPQYIPISWPVMRSITGLLWFCNQQFLKGKAKLPGIFVPAKLYPRFNSWNYSNCKAKEVLNWTPTYSLTQALERCCNNQNLLEIPTTIVNN